MTARESAVAAMASILESSGYGRQNFSNRYHTSFEDMDAEAARELAEELYDEALKSCPAAP
jgi:DNA-directed RNA polymerase subunit F